MNQWACDFFAGSVADWVMVFVTLLTGIAVAVLAYQANSAANTLRREAKSENRRRARTFGYMISVEVGGAQSAYYNMRKGLEHEVDGERIPDVEKIRTIDGFLNFLFLPHVGQNMGNVDLLPENCAVPLLSGMAAIENAKRSLKITLKSSVNIDPNGILTPVGMGNIDRVCGLLRSVETRFRDAHRALWAFNFPGQAIVEWQYPEGAILPDAQEAAGPPGGGIETLGP